MKLVSMWNQDFFPIEKWELSRNFYANSSLISFFKFDYSKWIEISIFCQFFERNHLEAPILVGNF